MRSFDIWDRYFDNENKPLHGCVAFMVRDGNTPAPIYDQDGTSLDNPQITDIYGRTKHQVFIEEDVTAYFYKYIGQGSLEDEERLGINVNDPSKWSLQFTAENQSTYNLHLTSDAAKCVSTIADLRALNPANVPEIDGKKVITLLGYYNAGDKEPINYVWDSLQTHTDTGGSYIKCNDLITGRWEMVQPTEHCDSRHFGAFPSNSYNMADQTYQIGQLFAYCSVHALRPFFNGSTDYRWFKYTNLNVICEAIDVTEETRFYDAGQDNTIQGEWNGNPHFTQNNTNVKAKKVRTSWGAKSYINYEDVIMDVEPQQKVWSNAHIDIRYSPAFGFQFDNCSFEENHNIGSDNVNNINNTFNNCKLNERMFILDGANVVSLAGLCTNCQIDMDDFRNSMWLYKEIRQTMDGDAFFDFRNMPNVGKPITNWAANKIASDTIWITNMKNLYANRYQLEDIGGQVTQYVLENCVGYYSIPAGMQVTLLNCSVKLRLASDVVISATGSNITLDETHIQTADHNPTISLRNSSLAGEYDGAYRWKSFTAYDSIVMCATEAMNCVVKDSQINAMLRLIAEPGTPREVTYLMGTVTVSHFIHGYLDNNIFNAGLIIDGQSANTIFGASEVLVDSLIIQNNRSNLTNAQAWGISRLGAMNSDALNYYTFVNNTGGFECTLEMHQVPIIPGGTLLTDAYNGMLTETLGQLIESIRWGTNISTNPDSTSYADTMQNYFTKMRMFVIGQYDTTVDVEIELIDNPGPGGQRQSGDTIYLSPNVNYVAEGGTVYNYASSIYGPSKVQAHLSTYSKYQNGTIDHSKNFIVPDLAKDPNSVTDEWQIRNFILGKGPGWFSGTNVNCSLRIRQLDKKN